MKKFDHAESIHGAWLALGMPKLGQVQWNELRLYLEERERFALCSLSQSVALYMNGIESKGFSTFQAEEVLGAITDCRWKAVVESAQRYAARAQHAPKPPGWVKEAMRKVRKRLREDHDRASEHLGKVAQEAEAARREAERFAREVSGAWDYVNAASGDNFDGFWSTFQGFGARHAQTASEAAGWRTGWGASGVQERPSAPTSSSTDPDADRRLRQAAALDRVARDPGATEAERDNARRKAAELRSKAGGK